MSGRRLYTDLRANWRKWEAEHPWRARYRRIARQIRHAYWEIRFRLYVLIHGHEC